MLPKLLKFKKVIISLSVLAFLVPTIAGPVQAFSSGSNDNYSINFYKAVFETQEMNLQSFVYETMRAMVMSVVVLIAGSRDDYKEDQYFLRIECEYKCRAEQTDCSECEQYAPENESESYRPYDPETGMVVFQNKGAIPQLAQFMGMIYANPPASGVQYVADAWQKISPIKTAYAQEEGVGWGKFDFALPIWQTFRNVAYVFFVLIIVFMGFAIMFRVKTSPQTVVTIQSALPRVVLALILITFSYAIVGFLTDIMYVLINITISLFQNIPAPDEWLGGFLKAIIPEEPTTNNFRLFMTMFAVGAGPLLMLLLVILILGIIGLATSGIGSGIALLIDILLLIILLVALIRVCWALIKAYVNVLIALVFAPFQLLVGALPGSKATGSWFRNLIANLAVWPTVFIMCFLAGYIALSGLTTTGGFFANFILLPIIGVGILLLTPKAADMIKAFMAGESFAYGTALGQAFGPARWAGQFAMPAGQGYLGQQFYQAGQRGVPQGKLSRFIHKKGGQKYGAAFQGIGQALGYKPPKD